MTDAERRVPPRFDPFSDEYFGDPYDLYRSMRDEAPVSFNDTYGFWALFRYDDVRAAHLNWQTFTSTHGVDLATLSTEPELVRLYGLMIMMDPPEHERARALVGRVFTPRAIQALEPMVAEVIEDTLALVDGAESFDAVAEFSGPFPVEIICRMLGVPAGERQQIRHWLDLTLERRPGELGPTPEGMEASIASWSYFLELTRHKRKYPGDDMISRLTQAEVERADGQTTKLDDGPAGRRRCRDGDQAGGQCRDALPSEPWAVRQGGSRPWADPRSGRGGAAYPAAVAISGTVLGSGLGGGRSGHPSWSPRPAGHWISHAGRAVLRPAR